MRLQFSLLKLSVYLMKPQAWLTLAVILDDNRTRTIFLLNGLLGFTVKKH